jgi:predicted HTH domain antitoxin
MKISQYIEKLVPDIGISIKGDEIEKEILQVIALHLYSKGYITSGKASKLLGISRIEFLFLAGSKKIPMFEYSEEELKRELENA